MGAGQSALKGLEIEEKAVEITDFWTHHSANIEGTNPVRLSVFISEPSLHSTASFGKPTPLEKNAKVCFQISFCKIHFCFLFFSFSIKYFVL